MTADHQLFEPTTADATADAGRPTILQLAPAHPDVAAYRNPPCGYEHSETPETPRTAEIVALNDASALYTVLAARIRGRASGWSPSATIRLRSGLRQRFGNALGTESEAAIERLMALACDHSAA